MLQSSLEKHPFLLARKYICSLIILTRDVDTAIGTAIGAAIGGTAWIADGGYANFRLLLSSGNFNNVSQLDDFGVYLTPAAVPEPSSYALLAGIFACTYMMIRRRKVS